MPTTKINSIEMRMGEQFDVWVLKSSGKTAATIAIKTDQTTGQITIGVVTDGVTKIIHQGE